MYARTGSAEWTRRAASCAASTSAAAPTGSRCSTRSPCSLAPEHRRLGARVGVAERQAHHEAVDLRLGQRVGALELDRVLRREHDERPGQLVRVDVDA